MAQDLKLTDSETGNVFREKFTSALEKTVDITVPGREPLKGVPVWVMPGHPDQCGTLYLGYGRKWAGRVGSPVDGQVGFDAYPLRAGAPGGPCRARRSPRPAGRTSWPSPRTTR
jgi:hypothetical protein